MSRTIPLLKDVDTSKISVVKKSTFFFSPRGEKLRNSSYEVKYDGDTLDFIIPCPFHTVSSLNANESRFALHSSSTVYGDETARLLYPILVQIKSEMMKSIEEALNNEDEIKYPERYGGVRYDIFLAVENFELGNEEPKKGNPKIPPKDLIHIKCVEGVEFSEEKRKATSVDLVLTFSDIKQHQDCINFIISPSLKDIIPWTSS